MSNSRDYQLTPVMKQYVIALMEQEGRDFDICEQCLEPTDGHAEIHHTRYEGATYYDLEIVCRSCNRLGENVGLA